MDFNQLWTALYNNIVNVVTTLAQSILALLPRSPFAAQIAAWQPPQYLGWLAWFFPVKAILSIIALWLTAVTAFYLISIIARWVKIIS